MPTTWQYIWIKINIFPNIHPPPQNIKFIPFIWYMDNVHKFCHKIPITWYIKDLLQITNAVLIQKFKNHTMDCNNAWLFKYKFRFYKNDYKYIYTCPDIFVEKYWFKFIVSFTVCQKFYYHRNNVSVNFVPGHSAGRRIYDTIHHLITIYHFI